MNVHIEIRYNGASRVTQAGSFQLRGRKPEEIALQFWRKIKKDMSYHAVLEKVVVNGEHDITELVRDLEAKELNDNLPF